jgi:hypothetical protein
VSTSETIGELAFTLAACPTATSTPTPSPTQTPPPNPTDTIDDSSDSCSLTDLTDLLANLDQALLKRSEVVLKASRAAVNAASSRSNLMFQTQRRAKTRTLSATAWAAIWLYPWSVLRCPDSVGCASSSLVPLLNNIGSAVKQLDSYVTATISAARRRVRARSKRVFFKKLRSEHSAMIREFNRTLETLPAANSTCPRSQ